LEAKLVDGGRVISAPATGPDRQNVRLLSHHEAGPYRLRVRLQIDTSYANQSYVLLCEVWIPGSGWSEVSSLLYSEINIRAITTNGRDDGLVEAAKQEILRLESLLLERALWVLKGPTV